MAGQGKRVLTWHPYHGCFLFVKWKTHFKLVLHALLILSILFLCILEKEAEPTHMLQNGFTRTGLVVYGVPTEGAGLYDGSDTPVSSFYFSYYSQVYSWLVYTPQARTRPTGKEDNSWPFVAA